MSNLSIHARCEPQRVIAFSGISSSYAGVGSGYANPPRVYLLQNLTDATMQFSFDGVNDHLPLGPGGTFCFDITANKSENGGVFNFAQGDRTYVKTIDTPTLGAVYVTIFYGSDN